MGGSIADGVIKHVVCTVGGQLTCKEYAAMISEMGRVLNCSRDFSGENPTGNYYTKVVVQ